MGELHLPWLELSIVIPLLGALLVYRLPNRESARRWSILFALLTLGCTLGEWIDFALLSTFEAHDHWDLIETIFGSDPFVVDELSAPLLSLSSLLYFLTILSTLRTKVERFTFGWALVSEAILLATLSCKEPWILILLLGGGCLPAWWELRARGQSTRVFTLHMGLSVALLIVGIIWLSVSSTPDGKPNTVALALVALGCLIRSGAIPGHIWLTDLFQKATFGTALLFAKPLIGAYAVMRLVLPIAPHGMLVSIAWVALATALYAAGMALVQQEARRFFCYLLLSQASLVLVGLELTTPLGLTGGLCVWLSVGLSLGGFGLTLRCVEARIGTVSLTRFHGLYDQMPLLAGLFLLTGLSAIGFPGTIGFIGTELLIEGAVGASPWIGGVMLIAAALNGIAILQVYFRVFTGSRRTSTISLRARFAERIAVLILTVLILGGGLVPQPGIASRYHAAKEMLQERKARIERAAPNLERRNGSHGRR